MRFLRFVALLLVVLLAYSAQLILHPPALTTSTSVMPPPLSGLLPDWGRLRALFAGDLRDVAFFMMALAAVTFGLLATPWPLTEPPLAAVPANFVLPAMRRRHRLSWLWVVVAILLAMGASLLFVTQFLTDPNRAPDVLLASLYPLPTVLPSLTTLVARAPWLTVAVWSVSLLLFLVGCGLFPWRFQQEEAAPAPDVKARPSILRRWPVLLLILVAAGLFYGWQLTTVPPMVAEGVAQTGLWAKEWLVKGNFSFFFTAPVDLESGFQVSGLATATSALFYWLTHDLLLSVRLAGLWGALLTIGATWLLGTELFRRTTHDLAETGADHGQDAALLAAILVMVMMTTIRFSRLPILLEMTGWGCLGCWALLRGLRTGDRLALGLSGVLLGLSAILYTPGLVFTVTALGWWLSYRFVQSGWLPHRLQVTVPAARFRGYFGVWVSGLWVLTAPTLGVQWLVLRHWWPELQGNLATNWQPTLLALIQTGDQSQLGGMAQPLLHGLLVPLLCLALGALCFNFDRRITWLLLIWLVSGLLGAMVLPATVPNWPALLPVVPALSLLLAFGLDRLRVTVLQSAGAWSNNLLNYLLLGLLLWVGVNHGVEHYHFAQQQVDVLSALGQELRTIPANQPVIIVGSPALPAHTSPGNDLLALRFFTNDWQRPLLTAVTFSATLPDELPAGTVVLLAPADTAILAQLQLRYPNGILLVRRDHLVNLLLYRYTIPAS